ncbi:hypothetical protein K461DRAFT_282396 [Myriangium duriaei CBS 260.36]|uniref:Uncharacterized protein n=1 Tax=Myriangium duriaei CBS 260.36 TaxID=1168546 RepID=A0A9P4ISL0_9PEZI|nr:hypothetical protein K461DRAFT_282396 [Myriangium duriaei CBS 260.36]
MQFTAVSILLVSAITGLVQATPNPGNVPSKMNGKLECTSYRVMPNKKVSLECVSLIECKLMQKTTKSIPSGTHPDTKALWKEMAQKCKDKCSCK